MRVIISGGGTGGHIFPAISIANEIRTRFPETEILFVGAENRMEMQRVPAAGYDVVGLPVAGFDRKNLLKNIGVLIKLRKSLSLAKKTIRDFAPDIAVGVGGYASGPTLKVANQLGIPTLIQEQNSYAGVTNKLLAKKAAKICVAYEGMERFFPKEKIVMTGNPVRQDLKCTPAKREEAYAYFKLDPAKKTVLIVGGSLGARTLNQSMSQNPDLIENGEIQYIWQTGKFYYEDACRSVKDKKGLPLHLTDFISRMDLAYSVADAIVSRAGASSVSEFCIVGKPVVLVPSPNVSEDHQTKNAMALVRREAAIMVKDSQSVSELIPLVQDLMKDEVKMNALSENIGKLALPDAASRIVDEIEKICGK
ncbi:MAG: undecaprenyldiphospho-muramoylpentapeptide beta-N-acetylglucosaminyltransferase [Dysgonamonadaceae bacterium]|jgi:UDP-N-acetylglucosamine--N-acetylmuramyl-(pentapeptide) pyrophosphoryl-undecaprenol N-acetylglucosamine transferase|nr:undecaprenyldiphospho-muramoylpentapeptide beta-N-acetylglucosaminyltransferase [Dysgonamonadaceae bacterium]